MLNRQLYRDKDGNKLDSTYTHGDLIGQLERGEMLANKACRTIGDLLEQCQADVIEPTIVPRVPNRPR